MATSRRRSVWSDYWGRVVSTSPHVRRFAVSAAVVSLLTIQASLLAYSATTHSPTMNEPGHLAAGLSYWEFGRFEVCRVNPPLIRPIAALPVGSVGDGEAGVFQAHDTTIHLSQSTSCNMANTPYIGSATLSLHSKSYRDGLVSRE